MHFEMLGVTNDDADTIVLSSGLGGSANYWHPQLPALTDKYRVIVYDQNGTGRSPASLPPDYQISDMADELLTLLSDLAVTRCHFVGHALGGLVGLQIATKHPEIFKSLVLVNAWSQPNPHTLRCFNIRKNILAYGTKQAYMQMQALLLYPPDWIASHVETLELEEEHHIEHFPDKDNLLARISALSTFNIADQLPRIQVKTLVIVNKDDSLVPWTQSSHLAENLPNAQLAVLDYGGHASNVTSTKHFNDILLTHLASN